MGFSSFNLREQHVLHFLQPFEVGLPRPHCFPDWCVHRPAPNKAQVGFQPEDDLAKAICERCWAGNVPHAFEARPCDQFSADDLSLALAV